MQDCHQLKQDSLSRQIWIVVLGNDVTTPVAIHEMEKFNKKEVFDKKKIALVMDHFTPNKDIKSAEHCKCVRQFSAANEIENYFDVGAMGISMRSFRRKDLSWLVRHVSEQTHIHVHTEHSVHSQQVSEVQIWQQEW